MPKNYDHVSGDSNLGDESARDLSALSQHIGEWWGEGKVWHEIISEFVHVDVHEIPPSEARPYHTLITTGMSDRAMKAPDGSTETSYCELMLMLPPEWPLTAEAFEDDRNYWPVRHLKQTARFPHMVETWVWYGHTVGNGSDLEPVAPGLPFVGFALSIPMHCEQGARSRTIREGKTVHFFALIPLHEAELRYAWEHGTQALFEKLDAAEVDEVVDITRPCVITGKRGVANAEASKPSLLDRARKWFKGGN